MVDIIPARLLLATVVLQNDGSHCHCRSCCLAQSTIEMSLSLSFFQAITNATIHHHQCHHHKMTVLHSLLLVTVNIFSFWHFYDTSYILTEGRRKKNVFLGDLSQMWMGGVADSQTRSKPLKKNPNCPENRPFRSNFTFRFPKSHKKP